MVPRFWWVGLIGCKKRPGGMYLMRLAGIPLPKDRKLRHPATFSYCPATWWAHQTSSDSHNYFDLRTNWCFRSVACSRQATKPVDQPLNGYGSGIEILEPIYEDDPVDVRARKFTKIVREFQFLFPDEYSKIRQVLGDRPVAELVWGAKEAIRYGRGEESSLPQGSPQGWAKRSAVRSFFFAYI